MNINSITIKNFKKIEDRYIEFEPGFNIIIGEPNTGKTSILESLAIGLSGYITGMNSVISRNIRNNEVRHDYEEHQEKYFPVKLTLEATVDGKQIKWSRERKHESSSNISTTPKSVPDEAHDRALNLGSELPILCYYTSKRSWNYRGSDSSKRHNFTREEGYSNSLSEAASMKHLVKYFDHMESLSNSRNAAISEYEAIKQHIIDFINELYGRNVNNIVYNSVASSLFLVEDGNYIDTYTLGEEMKLCIYLVIDIIYRMAILNPYLLEEINKTSGVVLIDELELHVSVKNQWKLINMLRKLFPNVQFIVTTNSPILLASADNVNVIKLYENDVEYYSSHYGVDINTSTRKFFGEYEFPEPVRKDIETFFTFLDKENYTSARTILNNLKKITAPEFPTIVEMETLYDLETSELE